MGKFFGGIATFFHNHPWIKTGAVTVGGVILTAAGQGAFGPQGAIVAGAISAVVGLFIRRPQDGSGTAVAKP